MLTAEQLQAIKKRAEKAFPAPWHTNGQNDILIENDGRLGKMIRRDDAQFVAQARQDIPALIGEVERQKANAEQYLKDNVWLHNENLALKNENHRLNNMLDRTELAEAKVRMEAEEMAKVAMDDTYNAFMEQREIKRLRAALEFYADEKNHTEPRGTRIFGDVFYDKGLIARQALAGEST